MKAFFSSPKVRKALSLGLLLLVVVFAGLALKSSWSQVKDALHTLTFADLAIAYVLGVVSVWALFRAWRSILHGLHVDTLSNADTRTMFFCSQLGKYVPGSVWPAVIQTEIGSRSKVPRAVVLTSYAFALVAGVGIGGLFTAGTWTHRTTVWVNLSVLGAVLGGIMLCAAFVHPRGSQQLWRRLLRNRVAPGSMNELAPRAMATVLAWTALGWTTLGVHAWVLARPLGASVGDLLFVMGSFALAWTAGLVALPLPAGAGLREVVLVITLGRLIGHPAAISVALVSRLLMIINDVVLSLVAGLPRVLREIKARD
ncbi:MAG: lysylphosphatidylglycerol synthase domain-containing protein [Actinomycetota bacterium]